MFIISIHISFHTWNMPVDSLLVKISYDFITTSDTLTLTAVFLIIFVQAKKNRHMLYKIVVEN